MMESIRYQTLKSRYEQYITCEAMILGGSQEYTIDRRRYQRADLTEVAEMIKYLEEEIAKQLLIDNGLGSRKSYGVVPRDV